MAVLRNGSNINGYRIVSEPTNDRSGTALWAFAKKSGKDYFIKQFLSPKKPNKKLSELENKRREKQCQEFSEQKTRISKLLASTSHPHVLRPIYFSDSSSYYVVTRKLNEISNVLEIFSDHSPAEKLKLLYNISSGVMQLHEKQIVHGDLKPDNIVFEVDFDDTKKRLKPTVIDLDSSFIEREPPVTDEGIVGDQVYMSPESYLYNAKVVAEEGLDAEDLEAITCKSDIFSLGVVFHYFLSGGKKMLFDSEHNYVSQAVIDGNRAKLLLPSAYSRNVHDLIMSMLSERYSERPDIFQVMNTLFFESGSFPKVVKRSKFDRLLRELDEESQALLRRIYRFNRTLRKYTITEEIGKKDVPSLRSIFESLKYNIFDNLQEHLNRDEPPEYDSSLATHFHSGNLRIKLRKKPKPLTSKQRRLYMSNQVIEHSPKLKFSKNLKNLFKGFPTSETK